MHDPYHMSTLASSLESPLPQLTSSGPVLVDLIKPLIPPSTSGDTWQSRAVPGVFPVLCTSEASNISWLRSVHEKGGGYIGLG